MNKFWKINNTVDSETAEMLIYGEISDVTWYGDEVTPKQFAEDLAQLQNKPLKLRVNSPGGDVFAAQAIYNQLKDYQGDVTVCVDGLAASAATIITCAGNHVVMPDNAAFMIHNPSMILFDSYQAADLKQMSNMMEKIKQTIVNVYLNRTGGALSEAKIKRMMDNETWMTAQEALDNGFIDEIAGSVPVGETAANKGYFVINSTKISTKNFKNIAKLQNIVTKKHDFAQSRNEGSSMDKNELLQTLKDFFGGKQGAPEPADAVQAERKRILDLEAMDEHDNPVVTKLINAAKANGATAESVKEYIDIVKTAKANDGAKEMTDVIRDNMDSGADKVKPVANDAKPSVKDEAEKTASRQRVVDIMNKMRG